LAPLSSFRKSPSRGGISELYAAVLVVGVTLAMGGAVAAAALGEFGLADGAASLGATLDQSSAEVQLGLVYAVASPSGSCPNFGGYHEGTALSVSVYDYGAASFTPAEVFVNGTAYPGNYPTVQPTGLGTIALTLAVCAHPSGQTLLLVNSVGNGVELES
jgi:hypothetical protein